jgi:hypothetical protein
MEISSHLFKEGDHCSPASRDDIENAIFLTSVISVIICCENALHLCFQKELMEIVSMDWTCLIL